MELSRKSRITKSRGKWYLYLNTGGFTRVICLNK